MGKPMVFVSGLSRCGTSLTMQMLHRAGLPCAGSFPDFEVDEANHRAIDSRWLETQAGKAIKWLNPHLTPMPPVFGMVIWLDRNENEQAKSQMKFVALMLNQPRVPRHQVRACAALLRRDRPLAFRAIAATQMPTMSLTFEMLLSDTGTAAAKIAAFLHPFGQLDAAEMARAVIPRSTGCQSGLDVELALIRRATEAA